MTLLSRLKCYAVQRDTCLNPCFDGMTLLAHKPAIEGGWYNDSLNPCFDGMTLLHLTRISRLLRSSLNPCFDGMTLLAYLHFCL